MAASDPKQTHKDPCLTMNNAQDIPWLRIAAEGVAIVISILLAFGIDTWWTNQREAEAALELRAELARDIQQTRAHIAERLESSQVIATKARRILTEMATNGPSASPAVLRDIGSVFVLISWQPVEDTFNEAVGSGRLNLLSDSDLRNGLSRYHAMLANFDRIVVQSIHTQYYVELEPFMVANTVYSEIAYDLRRPDLIQAPFDTDFEKIAQSSELWNLLTLRLELEVMRNDYLVQIDKTAESVLGQLQL